ncbi:MAG: NAD-dependent epimerase/dehydratase family protein [Leptospirales bacterium]
MNPLKVMVGGGCGFIGTALVSGLVTAGIHAIAVDDLSTGHPLRIRNERFQFEKGDTGSVRFMSRILKNHRPDVYIHAAGISDPLKGELDPSLDLKKTLFSFVETLKSIEESPVSHLILISSGEVYGVENEGSPDERTIPVPDTSYGASYLSAELYLSITARRLGVPYTIVRLSPVFGPGQSMEGEAGFVTSWARSFLRGDRTDMPKMTGTGKRIRDFLFVDDVVGAIFSIILEKKAGLFHLGSGNPLSERELFSKFRSFAGFEGDIVYEGKYSSGSMKRILGHQTLMAETGWFPETTLDEGVSRTVEWFRRWLG